MSDPIFILAGGATGGHLCPGIAVADALVEAQPSARVVFACADRPTDHAFLDELGYGMVVQPVRPLPRRLRDVGRFWSGWRRSRRIARDLVADVQPAAVLGLGGYAAGPVVREAARAVVATALLNPDAVPGKANRYLARRVDAIFTQFPETAETFGARQRPKIHCVGCPVRRFEPTDPASARKHFGLDPDKKVLLVLGGSLGALSVNRAVDAAAPQLAQLAPAWQLLHLTGGKVDNCEAFGQMHVVRLGFCDRMDLAYAAADMVLSRGGASTLAELADRKLPAAVMPYPYHRDMQQKHNGAALARAGAAVLIDDAVKPQPNAEAIKRILLPVLRDPEKLAQMKRNAATLADRSAAAAVAEWMLSRR
ncbi:MAG: UDP-N-acetylglucosamine--N-acetylmuramyl-(pentapeptide) pyrophosphoryl-undecaprenol N-acetylglucosamine transferase [Phycisphaerae bacterium]